MKTEIISKIENRQCVVGIIGLGYVGLPLILCFVEQGFRCIGLDIDQAKIDGLREGESYILSVSSQRIQEAAATGLFQATTDFSALADCDVILITVPTPLDQHEEPDLSFIVSTCKAIVPQLRKGQLIVLESTTYPGTTEEVMVPILERSGLRLDKDIFVAYSPEREDPNNAEYTTATIPRVVGSTSQDGLEIAEKLYQQIVSQTVPVLSSRVAEATKLYENIFRSVNIALVNELKVVFSKMGIDIWEVIEAASTKPFGFMPFYPGPGLGGHCIPIDPFYLTWKAREYGVVPRLVELSGEINTAMPDYVVERVIDVLSGQGKPIMGARILLLGLAYKPNLDDDRESPGYYLMEKLEIKGAQVSYHDPFIPVIKPVRKFSRYVGRQSAEISGEYDLILISTAHDEYKGIDFARLGVPVVDTKNITSGDPPLFNKA